MLHYSLKGVNSGTNLKRLGELFCSNEHMNQYAKTTTVEVGIVDPLVVRPLNFQHDVKPSPVIRS